MSSGQTPLGSVARGVLAGAAGTAAMTAAQTATMKLRGADSSGVPGEIAKRVIEGVYQRQVPEERVELLNNAMHRAYGTGLAVDVGSHVVYGLGVAGAYAAASG